MLLAPMAKRLEGIHMGFLIQETKLKAKSLNYKSWRRVVSDKVIQGEGTQPLHAYLDRIQERVDKWVALRPIFEVCARETGYEGGGNLW